MNRQEFIIDSTAVIKRVATIVNNLWRNKEEFRVIIAPLTKDMTVRQRGLYWQWMTFVGNELGDSKEYYHEEFKRMFLVNIFRRDDETYDEMLNSFMRLKNAQDSLELKNIGKWILHHTSITKCDRKQMSEYMDAIKKHCDTLAIQLPLPDDRLIEQHEHKEIQGHDSANGLSYMRETG